MMQEGEQKTDEEISSASEEGLGEADLPELNEEFEVLRAEVDRLTAEASSLKDEVLRAKA